MASAGGIQSGSALPVVASSPLMFLDVRASEKSFVVQAAPEKWGV
jgi:hypothetical protein